LEDDTMSISQLSSIVSRLSAVLVVAFTCLLAPQARAVPKLDRNICTNPVVANPPFGGAANYGWGYTEWGPGDPGRPMLRHTLTGVNARCNDGSPAVMYLRPAPAGSPNMDKWVIHFEGGGSCRDGDECLERWCGIGAHSFDQAAKMSSLGAPEGIVEQGGILNETAGGPFADYNQVLLAYCSSDSWIGSAAVGEPVNPNVTPRAAPYDIEFQGEKIVADVIATLRGGPTYADWVAAERYRNLPTPGYGVTPMPNLDLATRVILSGDSAGGQGARHHADRITGELSPNGTNVYLGDFSKRTSLN
jgi:hypothetical protein